MPSSLGSIFSTIGSSVKSNPLAAIGSGVGLISNLLSNRKAGQVSDAELSRQKFLNQLASNPEMMNKFVSQYEKPLDKGLTQGVGNEVQAYLAERGLSSSPQISEAVLSQALAPYIQQNQQTAISEAQGAIGAGNSGVPTHVPQALDLSKILSWLQPPNNNQNNTINPGTNKIDFPGSAPQAPNIIFDPSQQQQLPDLSTYGAYA